MGTPEDIKASDNSYYVICSVCGKRVSDIVNQEINIRAWVECPECLEMNYNIKRENK